MKIFLNILGNYDILLQEVKFELFDCEEEDEHKHLTKFLKNNRKNLKGIDVGNNDDSLKLTLNLAIAKFCPSFKSLCISFSRGEVDVLKRILVCCQQLERIKVCCGDGCLNESELLKVVAKHSPRKFYELRIIYPNNVPELFQGLKLFFFKVGKSYNTNTTFFDHY